MRGVLAMARCFLLCPLLMLGSMAFGVVGWICDAIAGGCSRLALALQGRAMQLWRRP